MESIRNYVITNVKRQKSLLPNLKNDATGNFELIQRNNHKFRIKILNNKFLPLNNKIREYFYFKISLSLLKNLNSSIKSKETITTERIYEISRKIEYSILNETKSSLEYKRLATKMILDIEKYTLDRRLWSWSHLKLKNNKHPRSGYHIPEKLKNSASIKSTGILTSSEFKCTEKNIKIISEINMMESKKNPLPILPNEPPTRSNDCESTESIFNINNIKNVNCTNNAITPGKNEIDEKNLCKIEKKDIRSLNDSNVTVIDLTNESEDLHCKLQSHEILRKRNVLDPTIEKVTYKWLKLVMKEYFLTLYIPNKRCYKYIFQTIHLDIMRQRIYDRDAIRKYAVQAIKSRKYL